MEKEFITLAVAVAGFYGIDPALFTRLIYAESRFDPAAVSPSGCVGLGQINLDAWPLAEWRWPIDDATDPLANLMQAGHIMRWLLEGYGHLPEPEFWQRDPYDAVAAYTLGHGTADKLIETAFLANPQHDWLDDLDEPVRDYVEYVATGKPSARWGDWSYEEALE